MPTTLLDLKPTKRDAILNAALKEFAIKGYDNASTNIIAKEAGISKALMFHYVTSKQELFLSIYDYFTELLDKEYFMELDFGQQDIFNRLRQSYLLQIRLMRKYPWIFDFNKLSAATYSEELNKKLEERVNKKQTLCYNTLFDKIDETKFRNELDIKKCKELIYWANVGFTNQLLDDIRNSQPNDYDYDIIMKKMDDYIDQLKKIFYQ